MNCIGLDNPNEHNGRFKLQNRTFIEMRLKAHKFHVSGSAVMPHLGVTPRIAYTFYMIRTTTLAPHAY